MLKRSGAFYGETWADVECTNCALEVAPVKLEVSVGSPSMSVDPHSHHPRLSALPGVCAPKGLPAAIRRRWRSSEGSSARAYACCFSVTVGVSCVHMMC